MPPRRVQSVPVRKFAELKPCLWLCEVREDACPYEPPLRIPEC